MLDIADLHFTENHKCLYQKEAALRNTCSLVFNLAVLGCFHYDNVAVIAAANAE